MDLDQAGRAGARILVLAALFFGVGISFVNTRAVRAAEPASAPLAAAPKLGVPLPQPVNPNQTQAQGLAPTPAPETGLNPLLGNTSPTGTSSAPAKKGRRKPKVQLQGGANSTYGEGSLNAPAAHF